MPSMMMVQKTSSANDRLLELIESHPKFREIRSRDSKLPVLRHIIEEKPESGSHNEFVSQTLGDPLCFKAPPVAIVDQNRAEVLAGYYLGPGSIGRLGYVHGGIISTIFDECGGRAASSLFKQTKKQSSTASGRTDGGSSDSMSEGTAVTVTLNVNYTPALPADSVVCVYVVASRRGSTKVEAAATMWHVESSAELGHVVANSIGLYVNPTLLQSKM